MTMTAYGITEGLHNAGYLDAFFGNTGGGVFCVIFEPVCQHGARLGEVIVSDNGDWGQWDYHTPAESVGLSTYAPNGDPAEDWEMFTTVADVVAAVEAAAAGLEIHCPLCVADH